MKLNNKILALLIVFVAIVSISAVSAEDVAVDDVVAAPAEDAVVLEASADAEDTLAATFDIPDGASVSDIETIINQTSAGDTLNFAENGTYDFGENDVINIEHTLILQGNGATIKGYQGFLFQADEESVAGSQVYNLNFEVFQPVLWNGRAIDFEGGSDYVVENCSFKNGNSGIYIRRPSGNVIIQNNIFIADDGATNQSTITGDFAKQETGSKAINIMGGSGIVISDNRVEGDFLDAFSIASGASNVEMYDNYVKDVWYGVFYGGGISNITMEGNVFENSKAFALGIIKAAGDSDINGNTFITEPGKIAKTNLDKAAIYVQEGNTAHGAPSNIETILIYENEFFGPESIAIGASSQGGMITPKGEFTVINNVYDEDVTVFQFNDNNTYNFRTNSFVTDNNVTIEENYPLIYSHIILINLEGEHELGDVAQIMLIGDNYAVLPEQEVEIFITRDGVEVDSFNATTNELGLIDLPLMYDAGEYEIFTSYDGEVLLNDVFYKGTFTEDSFTMKAISPDVIIVGNNVTIPTKAKQRFEILLKDSDNRLLVNQTVQFTINGVTYNRTTDENGKAGLNINLNMGDYDITAAYTTPEGQVYNETYVLTAVQSNTTIKSTPITFTGKGNKFNATLVDQLGQPIADAVVAFHIHGVTYYKVTDENGQFFLNINLGPGIYNMYMSFDGTFQYAASNGGSEVIVI
jgi:parallel beta-helix repeat protein